MKVISETDFPEESNTFEFVKLNSTSPASEIFRTTRVLLSNEMVLVEGVSFKALIKLVKIKSVKMLNANKLNILFFM